MNSTYHQLAQRVLDKWAEKKAAQTDQKSTRLIIALAGPPGSGKTTIAQRVVDQVNNSLHEPRRPKTVAISADGFHLPLSTLRTLPNADEAMARRGAPWTFDAAGAVALVRELGAAAGTRPVLAPTFDHEVKDPVAGGLTVAADVDVCIVEGNYLLVKEQPWGDIASLVDDSWLVHVDPETAKVRVAARHLRAGIESTMESALARAENNDMVNGVYVVEGSRGRYNLLIHSIDELPN